MPLVHPSRDIPTIATPIPHSLATYSAAGALISGGVGALVFSGLLWAFRMMGITDFSISAFLGSVFTGDTTPGSVVLGLLVHLVFGALAGLIYALIFHAWGWATWARGVAIAIPHALVAGAMMLALAEVHPLRSEPVGTPGFLAGNYGWHAAAILMALFLLFGAIVGSVYARFVPHLTPGAPAAASELRE